MKSQKDLTDDLRRKIAAIENRSETFLDMQGEFADRADRVQEIQEKRKEAETKTRFAQGNSEEEEKTPLDKNTAIKKVLRYCSMREHASEEIRKKLYRQGFSEVVVEDALEDSIRWGLVDDHRFAETFMRSRLSIGEGTRGIERKLEELKVPLEDIEDAYIACKPDASEFSRALDYLRAHPSRSKRMREGGYRKLIQHGYDANTAADAARAWAEEMSRSGND
ncbi:MAG: regulatory protein RecX [Eggerthellaceae bacterium]|jgi:regulatory protein